MCLLCPLLRSYHDCLRRPGYDICLVCDLGEVRPLSVQTEDLLLDLLGEAPSSFFSFRSLRTLHGCELTNITNVLQVSVRQLNHQYVTQES